MKYNIFFEASAVVYLLILNVYIRLQYSSQSRQNQLFQRLAVYMLTAVTLDVITAVTISYAAHIPVWVNMVLNFLYLVSVPMLEYQFLLYCLTGICRRDPKGKFFNFCRFVSLSCLGILVINFFTGWVFTFTADGEYIHGPLYYMTYFVAFFYIIVTTGLLLSESKNFNINQRTSIILYCISALVGPIVQFMLPHVLFALFTVSLGFVMLMFSMETPDYQQLMKTMDELARTRDEAEEAMGLAQAANQAKTDFLSAMSHELRTPINSILGFNEIIMQQTNDPEIAKCTDNVQSAGTNLLAIINNILDYTEIDNGKLKIVNSAYSVRSMIRDVLAYAKYGTDKSQLELITEIDENIPSELMGDFTRILQIFNSVTSNAVKYTYKGFVKISVKWIPAEDNTGCLDVLISDSGIGIKQEDLAQISGSFSFTRFDKKRTQNIQGVGLGLTIVTRLLGLMGGTMSIDSEYEKGTTVSFKIRQEIVNSEPVGEISSIGSGEDSSDVSFKFHIPDVKLLTVDDNAMNRELFKGLLKGSGAQIDAASGGREAISLLEKGSYNIIFMDHMMPEMDGIEAQRIIRERGLCGSAPIIVLTANTVAGAREMYLSEGFDDYLAKPVTGRMLYGMMKKHLPAEMIKKLPDPASAAEAEPKNPPRRKLTVMERLGKFLDTATGMTYCCEDEEFYMSMLQTYLDNSRLDDMQKFLGEKDYDNYRITVHSIKSTSLTIGAAELSEEAKKLEMAQKSGDIGYILENNQRVYEQYDETLKKIKAVLDDPDDLLGSDTEDSADPATVLVVDDDHSCLSIAKRTLETDFSVISADSGEAALRILENKRPDLAVLDVYMPEMDGFELLKRIRSICNIPVVFLTADSDKALEERCFREGAMDFITKPITSTILINRLSRVIELDKLKSQR